MNQREKEILELEEDLKDTIENELIKNQTENKEVSIKDIKFVGQATWQDKINGKSISDNVFIVEKEIKEIEIIGPQDVFCRRGTMGLTMNKKTCGEIADYLNHNGVGMMGHHFFCPGVCRLFGIEGTARISLHYWNTEEEIDQLIILLSQIV